MLDLLVLSGGHPYDEPAFAELLGSLDGWRVTHLLHPEAERLVGEGRAGEADGLLFYDMPGYTFADGRVETTPPSEAFRRAIVDRFAAGKGAVAMHHAIAGWAEWPEWAELVGGRFLYQPGKVRGQEKPDSGYRHEVTYTAEVVLDHPVTAGLPKTFPVTDEVYLAEVFADSITPLVRAQHAFVRDNFYSAAAAVAGRMFDNAGWDHAPGNDCVAWVKPAGAANLVYLQFGDAPETYANPAVRQILANALRFTAAS